jgi:Polyketide cyclase / dehydrase and lipid transport
MAEVEGSRSFGITGDARWAVVADPARLADWVPTIRRAEPVAEARRDEVHLEGESHGHPYSLDSTLRVNQGDRRLQWGDAADEGYSGWLRVVDQPPGSEVQIYVAVPDDRLGPSVDAAAAEIRRGMEDAFDRLAGLIGS